MSAKRKTKAQALPFHFYASTAHDWITGPSREYVLQRLASYYPDRLKMDKVKEFGGVECVVTRVELPQEATYTIRDFVPNEITERDESGELVGTKKRVPLRQYERLLIIDRHGNAITNPDLPQLTDEELAAEDDKPPRRYW